MPKQVQGGKTGSFDPDVKVRHFCSKSKLFFILSAALILISILSTFTGVDIALEFKGGTIITYSYVGDIDENTVEQELSDLVGASVNAQVGDSLNSDAKTLSLSFSSDEGLTVERQTEVTDKMQELYPDASIELLDANDVDARSGSEFFSKCIVAAIFAALILIVYIALRFKQISGWTAGVCAIIGLLSTLIVTYGSVVLCRFEELYETPEGKRCIRAFADRLLSLKTLQRKEGPPLWDTLKLGRPVSGMGHGMAGIAAALSRAHGILGEEAYLAAAQDGPDARATAEGGEG